MKPLRNVELEITLRCNRHCNQCNRFCNTFDFMPHTDSDMTLQEIEIFCERLARSGHRYSAIKIMGGEPLIHPEFPKIIEILLTRLRHTRIASTLLIVTNGELIKNYHPRVFDHCYIKIDWGKQDFLYTLAAPIDLNQPRRTCPVPDQCGIGANAWGFWPCGPAAAISRLFEVTTFQRFEPLRYLRDWGPLDEHGNLSICNLCQWSVANRQRIYAINHDEPSPIYRDVIERRRSQPSTIQWKRISE